MNAKIITFKPVTIEYSSTLRCTTLPILEIKKLLAYNQL